MLITEENFETAMMILQGSDEIAVDTEGSGLNMRNNVDYLMGFCFSNGDFSCYMPFRHKDYSLPKRYLAAVQDLLETKDLIWHNRKYDMHACKTIGIDPLKFRGTQYDTLIISHLVNEELYSHQLDSLAKKYLNDGKYNKDEFHDFGKVFGYANVPATLAANYGAQDARLTFRLKRRLWPLLLEQSGLEQVYLETEAPFTALLYSIEQRGVGVNHEFAVDRARVGRGRMGTLTRDLGFNPASPLALGAYLIGELGLPVFAHTGSCEECKTGSPVGKHKGKPSFNKKAMQEYDDILWAVENPAARKITEFRGWQKAVTSLYEPLIEKVGPDGLIRTDFKQHGTVTGRLSASDPNLQQVPRGSDKKWNGDAKSAFTSGRGEDYALIGWDYSQLELRLAAAYGNEALLINEFKKDNADPFSVLAPLIFGYLSPETRHDTKTFVYANLYGAGIPKIAMQLGRPISEVQGLYQNYHNSIKGIMGVSSQVALLAKQRGYVSYWDGRRRHIAYRGDSYKVWNSLCQGGGAQLVKKAMLRCKEFESDECQMVLQVHDEITFRIRRDLIPKYEPLIMEAMTDWPDFGVRMAVEGKEWK